MSEPFAVMAQYDRRAQLVSAVRLTHAAGYRQVDAYSPYPIEELREILKLDDPGFGGLVFFFGLIGALVGFGMQYVASVWGYPERVGGRPLDSWPAFIPVTFELAVLCAATTALVAMLRRCGLPQLYHPVFNVAQFDRASQDGFFLTISADDPRFVLDEVRAFLMAHGAAAVFEVPY